MRRALARGVAVAVGVVLATRGLLRVRAVLGHEVPWDFVLGQRLARAFLAGYDPYTPAGAARAFLDVMGPTGKGYPPTTAFWALPFAAADPFRGNLALCGVSVVLLAAMLLLIARELDAPVAYAVAAFGFVVDASFFLYDVRAGALSALIAFLYVAAWTALRRGRDGLAGVGLGLACTIKMFPGVMVLPFLVARRWRVVGAAAGAFAAIAALMTARYGWRSWPEFLAAQKGVADLWLGSIQNGSVSGIVARIARPACLPAGPVPAVAVAAAAILSLFLLGGALWLGRSAAAQPRLDLSFALFAVLSVVISQWSWEHYQLVYLLPAAIAAARLRDGAPPRLRRAGIAVLAILVGGWAIDYGHKIELQRQLWRGATGVHVPMHLLEVANWAPGLLLLGLLALLVLSV